MRELTRRTRGTPFAAVVAELRETLLGWKAYFGIAEVLSRPLRDLDKGYFARYAAISGNNGVERTTGNDANAACPARRAQARRQHRLLDRTQIA